jgi:hypothetical protein
MLRLSAILTLEAFSVAKIGSWWLRGVEAEPDERASWSQLANRVQSSHRAVGGKLFLTDRRLVFCPHWVDAATGGKTWSLPLADIARVGITPKGGDRFAGGLRDRLRIELASGDQQLFVIKRLDEVTARLSGAIDEPRQPPADSASAN